MNPFLTRKGYVIGVATIILLTSLLFGVLYALYPQNKFNAPQYVVTFPKDTVVFGLYQGNWTATVVGSNPLVTFSSVNKSEVELWALQQTLPQINVANRSNWFNSEFGYLPEDDYSSPLPYQYWQSFTSNNQTVKEKEA